MIDNRLQTHLAQAVSALPAAWQSILAAPAVAQKLQELDSHIEQRLADGARVYPAQPFRALAHLPPKKVRVVILGQDPYHGPGQAQGLAFSVPNDCKRPPSLRNIFKELAAEYPDAPVRETNDLSDWADQGVLLLNTSLTVEDGSPASHAKRGWEAVTDALIAAVARDAVPKVFMLWGAHAQAKLALLPSNNVHLALTSNHPSPLSAARPPVPFLGCGHFRRANEWLAEQGLPPVQWLGRENTVSNQGDLGI